MKKQSRRSLPERSTKKTISPASKKLTFSLVVNSIILLFLYYGAMGLDHPVISTAVMIGYMLIFGGFLIAYIIYNRGFTRKGITIDMLPDSWSKEKKEEYIADGKRRQESSKWMLSVIIPFLITFIAEAIYLFLWQGVLENIFAEAFLSMIFSMIA